MRLLLTALLLISCAKKYQTYHVIDKNNFDRHNPTTPITKKLLPGTKISRNHCEGQLLFMSNAYQESEKYLKQTLRGVCPKTNYLVNSTITEIWWTTIIYSRSCIEVEGYCAR